MENIHKKIDFAHPQVHKKIKNDIVYLKNFDAHSVNENEQGCHWRYFYQTPNKSYKLLVVIKRDLENLWSLKLCVFWLKFSEDVTDGEGKDVEYEILPSVGYDAFVEIANNKLKNHLLLGSEIYNDDYTLGMDKEIIKMIIELIKKFPEMDSLNFKYYEDLKKLYKNVISKKDDKEILDYIQKKYPQDMDKQFLMLRLDTIKSVDNYHRMNKMGLNPEI